MLVHLWHIQNKLVLKKDTDIIHVAMGVGGQKSFHTCWGGVQKVLAACEGGVKKVWRQKFSIAQPPPPHQSIYEHSLNDVRANIVWSWFQNDHMAYVVRMISTFICKYPPGIIPERCCCMTKILQLAILTWLSWVQGGGAECPETSKREIFADLVSGKDRQGKWGKKEENWKSEAEKFKMERGNVKKWGKVPFFFFFMLLSFQNDWNLFWVYQNGNFLPGITICRLPYS